MFLPEGGFSCHDSVTQVLSVLWLCCLLCMAAKLTFFSIKLPKGKKDGGWYEGLGACDLLHVLLRTCSPCSLSMLSIGWSSVTWLSEWQERQRTVGSQRRGSGVWAAVSLSLPHPHLGCIHHGFPSMSLLLCQSFGFWCEQFDGFGDVLVTAHRVESKESNLS